MNRESEAALYEQDYESDWYGMGPERKRDVLSLLSEHSCDSLLDVGAGRGEAMAMAELLCGFSKVMGTEAIDSLCNENVIKAYSVDLPFPDDSFEIVTCFDVLEHLIEDDLIPSVREFVRVSSHKVIVSAADFPFFYNGREQHISKRPASEWEELIKSAVPSCKVERCGTAGASPAWLITKVTYGH